MAYRDELEALIARRTALARELAEVDRLVDDRRRAPRLPVVPASRCRARWADMYGDDRARVCRRCDQRVWNLSDLTRDEAEALIRDRGGSLCVRYYARADGTILTSDCAVGVQRGSQLLAGSIAVLIATIGTVAHLLTTEPEPPEGRGWCKAGKYEYLGKYDGARLRSGPDTRFE
ncbi:MAG TPA: hypothetical protein VFQ53_12710 [Kofleriaceae bacterium]|nr:hypothetical protein [Kofleriaceae bacterium]